jgi:hypothetical protein
MQKMPVILQQTGITLLDFLAKEASQKHLRIRCHGWLRAVATLPELLAGWTSKYLHARCYE